MQKLEERLLKSGQTYFFRANGELKMDSDLLADEITKPADISFEKSCAHLTRDKNAVLSDRMHAYKKKYFRLDIIIGKVDFFHAWDLFTDEDELALQMLEQFKAYEIRTSLAMIPFYREKKRFII